MLTNKYNCFDNRNTGIYIKINRINKFNNEYSFSAPYFLSTRIPPTKTIIQKKKQKVNIQSLKSNQLTLVDCSFYIFKKRRDEFEKIRSYTSI